MMPLLPPELADFSVQELQFELMRRASGDGYNANKMIAFLLEHQPLWDAVLMDRIHLFWNSAVRSIKLPALYKLRDLPDNYWNVDKLYVLTPDEASRDALIAAGRERELWGISLEIFSAAKCQRMLTRCHLPESYRVFTNWWD